MTDTIPREQVFQSIYESADYGNLGTFIGAGFTKAILNDGGNDIALSWGQLLEKASDALGVDYKSVVGEGDSYPEIATRLCESLSQIEGISYDDSLSKLKWQLALLTSWYPEQKQREKYSRYLEKLDPSWIITTNYDLVTESVLTGKGVPLGPSTSMCAPKDMLPIYHLHGIRSNPESIIISQEDYITLFRPNEYRQIKLALTIKESTVLLIGYGLGDVNVLTALDWSKNVFQSENGNYPNEVIQVVRKEDPADDAYRDYNGITILEVGSLEDFFDSYVKERKSSKKKQAGRKKALRKLSKRLQNPDAKLVARFVDEKKFRADILEVLAQFPAQIISSFLSFLNKCLDETWTRSVPDGAFYAYDENLKILLDIITSLALEQIPPALLETIAYNLNRVAPYVGDKMGDSFAANETFLARKGKLPTDVIQELESIASQHEYFHLEKLLARI